MIAFICFYNNIFYVYIFKFFTPISHMTFYELFFALLTAKFTNLNLKFNFNRS